jgi:hypothetical protein
MLATLILSAIAVSQSSPTAYQQNVRVDGQVLSASIIRARLDRVRMKLGLAQRIVGRTESLAGIATRYGAIGGINGSFFEAYVTTAIKNPDHTLITSGRVVHVGNVGTMVGFQSDGSARIQRITWTIRGSRNGSSAWPQGWFAYWINRLPTGPTVTVFTSAWGTSTGLSDGNSVVVKGGLVTQISGGSVAIPPDGFVIYFRARKRGFAARSKLASVAPTAWIKRVCKTLFGIESPKQSARDRGSSATAGLYTHRKPRASPALRS